MCDVTIKTEMVVRLELHRGAFECIGVLDLQKAVIHIMKQTKVISETLPFEVLSFILFSTGEIKCALDRTSAGQMRVFISLYVSQLF